MEKISIELSEDGLTAYVTLNLEEEEYRKYNRSDLFSDVIRKLRDNGIIYGIKNDVILHQLENKKKTPAAEGTPPVDGRDAEIRMYALKEVKPEASEDGNVNHYELNLINKVSAGDWLGEKTHPTEGIPGKTVRGNVIRPARGKDRPLVYDRKSVKEVNEGDKNVLYALINGAVHYEGDRLEVSDHLEMLGDIDFRTGNINFDGCLTIKGTVADSFSASAQKDIEILGDIGVGSVREITSRDGSIYIRGGIAGMNKAVIRSRRNIYTKFVSNATIECGGSVHIGFYCLNSNIKAKEVILDSPGGQIIGGNVEAEIRVVASMIGSAGERRTYIVVKGFSRNNLRLALENIISETGKLRREMEQAKHDFSAYAGSAALSREQMKAYEEVRDKYFKIGSRIKELGEERKAMAGYLRSHGEGEVSVLKKGFPNTRLEIKGIVKEISEPVLRTVFFVQDGEMKVI